MDFTKLFSETKGRMNDAGWHHNKWSSKCEAFFAAYKAITEHAWPIRTFLNVGIGPKMESAAKNKFFTEIWPSIETLHNLEISEKTAEKARNQKSKWLQNIQIGDIKLVDEYYPANSIDLVFWNQGPEHIYREEWEDCFRRLDDVVAKAIYVHVPWGSGYDNDKWHFAKSIRKGELEAQGFTCLYHGVENTRDAGIMGYKLL